MKEKSQFGVLTLCVWYPVAQIQKMLNVILFLLKAYMIIIIILEITR